MIVANLNTLSRSDITTAGGKAAMLGELINNDFPVPPGFVVTTEAYRSFLNDTGIGVEITGRWHELNPDDIHAIEETSRTIRGFFRDTALPRTLQAEIIEAYQELDALYVAVRSSATAEDAPQHSWAGELESFMHVTEAALIDRVRDCWSSLFTPRAISYRHAQELHGQDINVAVVVQDMIDSDVAGVCFTQHPITKDPQTLLIEAVWGLGLTLAEGLVTPDTYVYDKKEKEILDIVHHAQETTAVAIDGGGVEETALSSEERDRQKLSEDQIIELAKLCSSIETLMGTPQDIEWVIEDDKLFIVQSRPIVA